MSDPATQEWQQALDASTSAQLRQTQRDLAASQADLTRAKQELADEREKRARDISAYNHVCCDLYAAEKERDEAQAALADYLRKETTHG